jgi:ABC-type multidrug transport system ATPase subunit
MSPEQNSETLAIELKNLSKTFTSFKAIQDVSIAIEDGEVFGLLGPNGAGKTTTMRIISCLLFPTGGDVLVRGKSVKNPKNRTEISREIGLLTESPNVYERLTAEQNLVFFARAYGVPEDEIDGRVRKVLEEFDLGERRLERAGTFSKGMKQKLAIARALVHNPSILLLDEPTASLDAESAKMIRSQISETARSGGHTVLLSTHNLDDASRLCDRVAFISHGKIVGTGTEEELYSQVKRNREDHRFTRVLVTMMSTEGFSEENLSEVIPGTKSIHKNGDGKTIEMVFDEDFSGEGMDAMTSRAVHELVAGGAKITGVIQTKPTLEDLYLEIMAEERKSS